MPHLSRSPKRIQWRPPSDTRVFAASWFQDEDEDEAGGGSAVHHGDYENEYDDDAPQTMLSLLILCRIFPKQNQPNKTRGLISRSGSTMAYTCNICVSIVVTIRSRMG